MMDVKKLILDNKDYALKLVKDLVSFESVLDEYVENGDAPFGIENKKALDYILDAAAKDGFITKNIDNYAGHIEFGTGEEILGVLAHLDVVPVKADEWITPPFMLDIRDGKMYGRGTTDDKGPLVASYIALKILKDSGFKPSKRIRLIMGCDEESGSRCLERYLEKEEKPTLGFSPDAEFPVIHGEKGMMSYDIKGKKDNVIVEFLSGTRYNIVPSIAKCKLNVNLDKEFNEYLKANSLKGEIVDGYYVLYGKASHAMCPQNGVNAAVLLFAFINKYTDSVLASFVTKYFYDDVYGVKLGYNYNDPEMHELTSNLAVVNLDNNGFKIGVNCRIPVDEMHQVIIDKVTEASKEFGYEFELLSSSKRHYISKDSTLVKALMKSYQEVTGDYKNQPFTIGGGTYAREIGNAVAFGPVFVGREDVCHIANEYMYLEDFYNAIEIYVKAIYELTK